jgi:hypothetical protein
MSTNTIVPENDSNAQPAPAQPKGLWFVDSRIYSVTRIKELVVGYGTLFGTQRPTLRCHLVLGRISEHLPAAKPRRAHELC